MENKILNIKVTKFTLSQILPFEPTLILFWRGGGGADFPFAVPSFLNQSQYYVVQRAVLMSKSQNCEGFT